MSSSTSENAADMNPNSINEGQTPPATRRRCKSRPSTAPAREDIPLLPAVPSVAYSNGHMQTVKEDEDISPKQPMSASKRTPPSTHDWPAFMAAYATGMWDPVRIPNPPGSFSHSRSSPQDLVDKSDSESKEKEPSAVAHSNSLTSSSSLPARHRPPSKLSFPAHRLRNSFSTAPTATPNYDTPSTTASPSKHNMYIPIPSPSATPFTSALTSPYTVVSAVTSSSYAVSHVHPVNQGPSTPAHTSQAAAAALRIAGTHVSIAPLALPSPEHELTDPMRGVNTAIPGAHPEDWQFEGPDDAPLDDKASKTGNPQQRRPATKPRPRPPPTDSDLVTTPGGTKKRLSSRMENLKEFWEGTQEVEGGTYAPLMDDTDNDDKSGNPTMPALTEASDYFSHQSATQKIDSYPTVNADSSFMPDAVGTANTDPGGDFVKRINLTRQTSAPLPVVATGNRIAPLSAGANVPVNSRPDAPISILAASDSGNVASIPAIATPFIPGSLVTPTAPSVNGTADAGNVSGLQAPAMHKEELLFHQLGYLVPPAPPDESERKRALYKFNIWNTGSDINFDRIAHLAKLVFNTRGVFISLIDGTELWLKSEWGMKLSSLARSHAFCAHTILLRDDEPMVILDTHLDWRFARNPLVIGEPHIRFYAGAPLRTQDGYNVGSLAVIDDSPREDFTPRHRHTLKEFAAIAMREMELWKDKIQLRIRDRIQTSMEEFSRECLEIDVEEPPTPSAPNGMPPAPPATRISSRVSPASRILGTSPQSSSDTLTDNPPDSDSLGSAYPERPARHPRTSSTSNVNRLSTSMDKIYSRAARLIQRTLDVEGVIVMDVSHCEVLEPASSLASSSSTSTSSTTTPVPTSTSNLSTSRSFSRPVAADSNPALAASLASASAAGTVSVIMHYGDPETETQSKTLTGQEYHKLLEFFARYPTGGVFEGVVPAGFKLFLPGRIKYALVVPIFNIDKRPFALSFAYNASDHTKRFLEGHELSYLRAIGVIILSAVLKRRMLLADKSKSLFISNISHELRTPLQGILSATEMLDQTNLNQSQAPILQSVRACATSLVETVNHVLDFTKLSGNSKSGGVENVILPTKVDLVHLVEEAIDGCWIGYHARTDAGGDSGIGTFYSPPKESDDPSTITRKKHVETVIDIGHREGGWLVKCEKGGIRRVLMNLVGNSLKFTSDGFVHIKLRQLPSDENESSHKVMLELSIHDTGKGISQSFLKNQLFHPFSQENPLQTGTGLGLAIVNSIVQSDSVNGNIDVCSEEGVGTEIKVTFQAEETWSGEQGSSSIEHPFAEKDFKSTTVSLVGFNENDRGVRLLHSVTHTYLMSWWGFQIVPPEEGYGDIVILNEDVTPVITATANHDNSRPFIILSEARGSPTIMSVASEYELIGGLCRVIHKPGGPSGLRSMLKLCLRFLKLGVRPADAVTPSDDGEPVQHKIWSVVDGKPVVTSFSHIPSRRNSEEGSKNSRPRMMPRSSTADPATPPWQLPSTIESDESGSDPEEVKVAGGGTLLKSSIEAAQAETEIEHRRRVLVVEDNNVIRELLVRWLLKKGYDFRQAVNGREGVDVFERDGPFDVVLLDLSMPILDGVGATAEIRQIEKNSRPTEARSTKILAMTGMSSLEDKQRAFEAGVDGYFVKPVGFTTLEQTFHKFGLS